MGITVVRSPLGFRISVCDVNLTAKGKDLLDGKDGLQIMEMHRDIVPTLPAGTELLGSSPQCAVEGFYVHKKLIAVQSHPEFTGEVMKEIVEMRRAQGIFGQELFEDGIRRAGIHHDGDVVAKAFLRFLTD